MKKVEIYTDGACSGNPGEGGWGAILRYGAFEREISGYEPDTTNNRMELKAAIEGLRALKESCEVELFSDSSYMVNAFEKNWIYGWKFNGWKTKNKDDVKNMDLWRELDMLCAKHYVNWIKVKGHSDNEYNNRCDQLATGEIKKKRKERYEEKTIVKGET